MACDESASEQSFHSHVERVRKEIEIKFLQAHKLLQEREAYLLMELKRLVDEFSGEVLVDKIQQLSDSKEALIVTLKGNENTELLNQSLSPIDARIQEFETKFMTAKQTYKSVSLVWDDELEKKLSLLGDVILNAKKESKQDYTEITEPIAGFGKHSEAGSIPGVFCYPNDIAINPANNNILICDSGNNRVQVYNASGEYLFLFDEKMDGPSGVCIAQNKIYVTQYFANCVNVYSTSAKFETSVGCKGNKWLEFNKPRAIAISTKHSRIYIAEFDNNRIQSIGLDLKFLSIISNIYGAMDVKLTAQEIVLLSSSNPCVSLYSYSNQLIRRMILWGGTHPLLSPSRLLITLSHNSLLITDSYSHCVCVYSCEGSFLSKFGKSGEKEGELIQPRGLAIDAEGRILVASENPNQCIQCFPSQF